MSAKDPCPRCKREKNELVELEPASTSRFLLKCPQCGANWRPSFVTTTSYKGIAAASRRAVIAEAAQRAQTSGRLPR